MGPAEGRPVGRAAVAAWALYDLANTIFSFNVLSLYFPGWVKEHFGASDTALAVALSTSMLLVALTSPVLGAWSDRTGRRIPFLAACTLVCVGATATLGLGGLGAALVLYAVANFFFQLGLVFYDALLPSVSTPETVGRTGGFGVGLGYFGSFIGLGVGAALLAIDETNEPLIFAATAGLFLVFAVPCFLFVRERRRAPGPGPARPLQDLRRTFQDVRRNPPLWRFLASRFLYTDAANTLIVFMVPYAIVTGGFTVGTAQPLAGLAIAGAIVGGFAGGRLVDRHGPKRVLQGVLAFWLLTLALVIAVGALNAPRLAWWIPAGMAGAALGGTWAADRPLMLQLVPPERVGEFYGVYGMVGRFAAVGGPLLWAVVAEGLGLGQPAAVASLYLLVAASLYVLSTVRPRPEDRAFHLRDMLPWRGAWLGPSRVGRTLGGFLRAHPFTLLYVGVAWLLFIPWMQSGGGYPQSIIDFVAYRPRTILADPLEAARQMVTAPWFHRHLLHLGYITLFFLAIAVPFEAHEGLRRTLSVFILGSLAAALIAGPVLLGLIELRLVPVLQDDLTQWANWGWVGGSAGTFALFGASLRRSARPRLMLATLVGYEFLNEVLYLQNFTPVFHMTALTAGWIVGGRILKPTMPVAAGPAEP